MATTTTSRLNKVSLWIIRFLLLLLSLARIASGQFLVADPKQHSSVANKKINVDNNYHDEDLSALLYSNTFCKFIFNGPEDDDDDGETSNKSPERITRSLEPEVSGMNSHSNRHHHHHHHVQQSHRTTVASLNQITANTEEPATIVSGANQTAFSNQQKSKRDIDANAETLNFDTNLELGNTFDVDPTGDEDRIFARRQKKSHKKNLYYHYSYSPPSDSHPVYIGLEIIDVDRINDAENYFSLQLYLFEMWHEPRLNTTALKQYWAKNSDPIPVLEANIADCLWTPSLVFEDSTEKEHLLPPTNILLAHHDKVLLRKSKYSLKVRCHMNLQIYPMDKHSCHFKLRAFADPVHKVVLKWLTDPGSPKPDLFQQSLQTKTPTTPAPRSIKNRSVIFSPEFGPSLFDIRVGKAVHLEQEWLNEKFSLLSVEFIFERRIIHSLLTVYIPSSLIVTLSWLQFWFDVEAVPGRMSLGIMSTLTIMTQILTNYEKAGNHVTAVDIWLFVCLIMVFLALMEYALAYTISHYYDNDDDFDDDDDGCLNDYNIQTDGTMVDSTIEKIKPAPAPATTSAQQSHCNSLASTTNLLHRNLFPHMFPTTNNNQVDPLNKNASDNNNNLSVDINGAGNGDGGHQHHQQPPLKDHSNKSDGDHDKENNIIAQAPKETMATLDLNVVDRIQIAQQKVLVASQELEILLNEKFFETIGIIQSVRASIVEAQRIHSIMSNNMGAKPITMVDNNNNQKPMANNALIHQRRSMANSGTSTISAHHNNRLSKFRQSLRRQMSARNLKATKSPRNGFEVNSRGGGRSKLSEVDYCSRYLFPFAFVLFATAYWIALIYYKLN